MRISLSPFDSAYADQPAKLISEGGCVSILTGVAHFSTRRWTSTSNSQTASLILSSNSLRASLPGNSTCALSEHCALWRLDDVQGPAEAPEARGQAPCRQPPQA
eukprot:m.491958 g.491958  ORF g.491958 m.491958 type:complete len:104 (-) comp57273_c0_seq6:442-753(-)